MSKIIIVKGMSTPPETAPPTQRDPQGPEGRQDPEEWTAPSFATT